MNRLGILLNPVNNEGNRWKKQLPQDSRVVVITGDPNNLQVQWQVNPAPLRQKQYCEVTIIGHGGDGNNFFNQNNNQGVDAYIEAANEVMQGRVCTAAQDKRFCRLQVCSAGTQPNAENPLINRIVLPAGWTIEAPRNISFIFGGAYMDLAQYINDAEINADSLPLIVNILNDKPKDLTGAASNLYLAMVPQEERGGFAEKNKGQRFKFLRDRWDNNNNRVTRIVPTVQPE